MTERISFYDQISKNKRDSIILIGVVGVILTLIIYAIGAIFTEADAFVILIFATIFVLIYTLIGYHNSDKIALSSVGAKKADATIHKQYYSITEGLTIASGLPMPKLYIMDSPQINAFATGRDPRNSAICVTTGSLEKLNKQELEGVLAHEMSHIKNFDIRFMTLTAVLIGLISLVSQIFLRTMWLSSGNRNNNSRNNSNGILIIIGLILAILSPILNMLVQLAISRKREYSADATAVKFTRTPTGLINALEKIKKDSTEIKVSGSVAPLFISKPSKTAELFSTHPPIEKRISILKKM